MSDRTPVMTPARESSARYRAADGTALPLLLFEPVETSTASTVATAASTADAAPTPTAGIILFHGGALRAGSAETLAAHCRSLASHGVFAVSAGYRLLGQGATSIDDCVADVRLAVEEFRRLAASRGLEAANLASGGSSAGAHLALIAAMKAGTGTGAGAGDGAGDARVAAVVALNPAGLDLCSIEPESHRRLERRVGLAPGRLAGYSVIEHVRPGNPPVLIQHGTSDEIEPIDSVRRFREVMEEAGNTCTVVEYENAKHAFHYPDNGHFDDVLDVTVGFLRDHLAGAVVG